MAVDPWVGELELIDNHHWITIISLIVIDPHYSSSIKEFRKEQVMKVGVYKELSGGGWVES